MKTNFFIGLLVGIVLISGCVQQESSSTMIKIVNAKLESGSLILSLEAKSFRDPTSSFTVGRPDINDPGY